MGEEKGGYYVQSTYRLLCSIENIHVFSVPQSLSRKTWSVKILIKFESSSVSYAWVLPTATVLLSKGVDIDRWCHMCHMIEEYVFHILVKCTHTRHCWKSTSISYILGSFICLWSGCPCTFLCYH